jgi:hypothetical protein
MNEFDFDYQNAIDQNNYIFNHSNKKIFYREVCEDLLYVVLFLDLAYSIINSNLKNYISDEKKFFSELESILKTHYDNNIEGYNLLNVLRIYKINFSHTTDQLKQLEENNNKKD